MNGNTQVQPRRAGIPRILWLIKGDEYGGVAQAVRGLTGELLRLGGSVEMVCLLEGAFAAECRQRGMPVRCLNPAAPGPPPRLAHPFLPHRSFDYFRLLRFQRRGAKTLLPILRDIRPDVVHVVWPDLMPVAAAAAARAAIACFWEMPNSLAGDYPARINRRIMQWQAARFHVSVLANSRYTAETFGDQPVKPRVLYLGADETRFDPTLVPSRGTAGGNFGEVARSQLGIPDSAIVLGIFGRVTPAKGHERVLQALAARGVGSDPPVHLLILGDVETGAYAQTLRDLARSGRLADRLHLLGYKTNPERYYGLVDIAVNARIDPEPFGLSVVEAMMMGKPVLVHALGGPAETVLDGVTGWHVAEPSVEAFEHGLQRALADRPRWAEMGRAARQRALEHFSLRRQARQYLAIVNERLGAARAE